MAWTAPPLSLRPWQDRAVARALAVAAAPGGRALLVAPTGCHARGEEVLRADGRRVRAEDVRVGDHLTGDGEPVEVLSLHRGRQEMARITPTKGTSWTVNLDHILTLVWTSDDGTRRAGQLVDVSVREYLGWSPTARHLAKLVRRPAFWGSLSAGDLPVDPYLLGVLLGDGCLSAAGVVIANSSAEIAEEVRGAVPAGILVRRHARGGAAGDKHRLSLVDPLRGSRASERVQIEEYRRTNGAIVRAHSWSRPRHLLRGRLADLGLSDLVAEEKFVPDAYLYEADSGARSELLAGLIDTDGSLTSGGYDWISSSPMLAGAVVDLARGLGLAAYLTPTEKRAQNGTGGIYYRVSISGDCSRIPVRILRKRADPRRQKKDVLRTAFAVEVLPEADYFGWTVSGDGRYLLADFTLTHNSGKGTAMLAAVEALRAAGRRPAITTPSGEIVRGLLDRLGLTEPGDELTEAALWKRAEGVGIFSPVRLRNRLAAGLARPDVLLADEGHHLSSASVAVWEKLVAALPGVPILGWTATPYRGSHKETEALRAWWGEPEVLLTIAEAAENRYLSVPTPEIWPLLDESDAKVAAGGEYDEGDLERLTKEQRAIARLVKRIAAAGWVDAEEIHEAVADDEQPVYAKRWDRPTLVAVASVALAHEVSAALTDAGLPALPLSGETPRAERDALLARCRAREIALCQVQVLAEGVDMPWLRRLVDLRPLRSPVAWMQILGRITRPITEGEAAPEYVCGCRNAERHGFLLTGQWPARNLAQITAKNFGGRSGGGPLERGVARDALKGRQVARVPLLGGGTADVVHLGRQVDWTRQDEILVVGVPGEESPRVFSRAVTGANGMRVWGKWATTALDPAGFRGWSRPAPDKPLSEKQQNWWRAAAASKGLDSAAKISKREFAVLPALADSCTTLLPPDAGKIRAAAADAAERIRAEAREATRAAHATAEVLRDAGRYGAAAVVERTAEIHARQILRSAGRAEAGAEKVAEEVERLARETAEAIRALEEGGPYPAGWAKLEREGGTWGARINGPAAQAVEIGTTLKMRTQGGREEIKEVARVVARGADYCLTVLRERGATVGKPRNGLPSGRYAVEDSSGNLRFVVVSKKGWAREQAGPNLYPLFGDRLAEYLKKIAADPAAACARYGKELGICGRCGRPLTDAASRAAGIGPVCAGIAW